MSHAAFNECSRSICVELWLVPSAHCYLPLFHSEEAAVGFSARHVAQSHFRPLKEDSSTWQKKGIAEGGEWGVAQGT